jgi:hypothetical protein
MLFEALLTDYVLLTRYAMQYRRQTGMFWWTCCLNLQSVYITALHHMPEALNKKSGKPERNFKVQHAVLKQI